jgi:hypothetical protein
MNWTDLRRADYHPFQSQLILILFLTLSLRICSLLCKVVFFLQSPTQKVDMLRGLKKPQILLALVISLSLPPLSGYLLYCDLADDDFSYPDLKFENADIDDLFLVPDCQNHLKLFESIGSNALLDVFFPETSVFKQLSPLSYQSSSLVQETLVLRC